MPRSLRIAAVQMDAAPAPKPERLARAADLIAEAAASGAQLVVLPEVFNTGYEYHENNYELPEPIDGETVTWMKAQAREHNLHLAGSLLLLDGRDVYNSQILVAPDGRRWRYDKNYPYAFERAYFRDGGQEMIAQTDIGDLGMMICWDYAHPELWARYAGKVDAMVITSSPPTYHHFQLMMPDGSKVDSRALGPLINTVYRGDDEPFGRDMDTQVAWLGVPTVNTTGGGTFRSTYPRGRIAIAVYTLFRPNLWRFVGRGADVEMVAGYYAQTKVLDATGTPLSRVEGHNEGFCIAEVELADEKPLPNGAQPDMPYTTNGYFFIDHFAPALMEQPYREGIRRHWGQRMAPNQRSIRWTIVLGLGLLGVIAGLIRGVGQLTSRNKK